MDGFDIRTLALTNILMDVFFGGGALVFARVHASFRGFKFLALSYFLFALGFIFLGLRNHISDFLSVVVANLMIITAFSLLLLGILKFLKYDKVLFEKIAITILLLMFVSFTYYTYVDVSVNARIIIITAIMAGYSIYIGVKILSHNDAVIFSLTRFLGFSFVCAAFIFLFRMILSFQASEIDNFMNAGVIHAFSLIALQFISVSSCFSLVICAHLQLADKLSTQATIDSLTNIFNRRAFDELAIKAVLQAQRELKPISLILIDIDFFKQINDNHGHQVGDKVLQEFSQRLQSCLRQYDILARYGGEEFVLLLPNTNETKALIIAEKLRSRIENPTFFIDHNMQLTITASFGVATKEGEDINWERLIELGDLALYSAKSSGRNCVKVHEANVFQLPVKNKKK